MRVILETVCGCRAEREIPAHSQAWHVPLFVSPTVSMAEPDPALAVTVNARVFYPTGRRDGVVPVWRERETVPAVTPGAPRHLTHGEWADAVGRARSWCRGDLAEMDNDFLRRHDGGTILAHTSGALIGAFYVAPGWEHSEMVVRAFSALRDLMGERP